MAHVRGALFLVLAASQLVGCLAHERDAGDAGTVGDAAASCGGGAECSAGNHCYCGRCISLDLAPGPCDPPCATAMHGDLCTAEGRVCPISACTSLVCTSGSFVTRPSGGCDASAILDAGAPDTGWCECPAPPPGCVYDGTPCGCSHMTCAPARCGREVCAAGTTCCNPSCGICVAPGSGCIDSICAPNCTPQDAHSGGRCAGGAGWAWDGAACRELACRCDGTECDDVFPSLGACNAYFSACTATDCTTDDATGVGGCAVVLGYAFSSRGCFAISGCSCTGADCARVVGRSETACNDAHASCPILFL